MKAFLFATSLVVLAGCGTLRGNIKREKPATGAERDVKISWLPSTDTARGTVLLLHGLNTSPEALRPIGHALADSGFHAGILHLSGLDCTGSDITPNDWRKDLSYGLREAKRRAPEVPVSLLGYSLGGLIAVSYFDRNPEWTPERMVLLAPALCLRCSIQPIRFFTWLRHFDVSLPSVAPREYRACDTTSLAAYHAVISLYDSTRLLSNAARLNESDVMILQSPDDLLIRWKGMQQWLSRNRLEKWQLEAVAPYSESPFPSHVILDESSLGKEEWDRISQKIVEFLE